MAIVIRVHLHLDLRIPVFKVVNFVLFLNFVYQISVRVGPSNVNWFFEHQGRVLLFPATRAAGQTASAVVTTEHHHE